MAGCATGIADCALWVPCIGGERPWTPALKNKRPMWYAIGNLCMFLRRSVAWWNSSEEYFKKLSICLSMSNYYRGRYCKGKICWTQSVISNAILRKEIRVELEALSQINKQMLEEPERAGRGTFMMEDNKGRVNYIGSRMQYRHWLAS